MSTRGAKGSKAASAVGSSDGTDFKDRQVLHSRYDALAHYRARLRTLFNVVPVYYAAAIVLTAIVYNAPGLASHAKAFLPPFAVTLVALLASGAVSVRGIYLQTSRPLMVLTSVATVFLLLLALLFGWQLPPHSGATPAAWWWWALASLLHAVGAGLHALVVYDGYMITQLQDSGKTARKR